MNEIHAVLLNPYGQMSLR